MTSRKRVALAGCSVFFFAWLRSLFSAPAAGEADEQEDHRGDQRERDRPEPPDGRRGQRGELYVLTLRGEEQVAAHRGRLDRLPASVGPADKDGAVIHAHLLGREIADRVLGQRVAREGKLPLLGNGAVDGHGGQRPLGEEGEIVFKRGAAVIRKLRERVGIGRLRGGGERVRLVELALDEENAAAVRALRDAVAPAAEPPATAPMPARAPAPQASRPAAATSAASLIGGASLSSLLSQARRGAAPETAPEAAEQPQPAVTIDPASGQKLESGRTAILDYIRQERPRLYAFFEQLRIEGHTLRLAVPTEALREEILRSKLEMLTRIAAIAGVEGALELEVTINEQIRAVRPIKLEDRLRHMNEKNPLLAELRRELDLEVE